MVRCWLCECFFPLARCTLARLPASVIVTLDDGLIAKHSKIQM